MPTDHDPAAVRAAMWGAINEYAQSCGGDTGNATVSDRRMNAVAAVERLCGPDGTPPVSRAVDDDGNNEPVTISELQAALHDQDGTVSIVAGQTVVDVTVPINNRGDLRRLCRFLGIPTPPEARP